MRSGMEQRERRRGEGRRYGEDNSAVKVGTGEKGRDEKTGSAVAVI
jgi:hypothetical protein